MRGRTVFPLWLDFDEDLALAHDLDDLADIAPRLMQKLQFLPKQPHCAPSISSPDLN